MAIFGSAKECIEYLNDTCEYDRLKEENEVLRQALHIAVGKLEEIKTIGDDVYLPPGMNMDSMLDRRDAMDDYHEKVTGIIRGLHTNKEVLCSTW